MRSGTMIKREGGTGAKAPEPDQGVLRVMEWPLVRRLPGVSGWAFVAVADDDIGEVGRT